MIEARDLVKRYDDTLAVDHLSFTVQPGRVTGFLGPNGAGKSTTMRMILGLDRPTSGTALVNGRPYAARRQPLREVGALIDADAVHDGRNGVNHLRALAISNGIPPSRVGEVLRVVGMDSAARRRVGKYSLGMRQRLGIAAALLGDPGVLLFDEPVNGLDPEGIRWVRDLLKGLAAEGRTVFVSSHIMSEMALMADDLVVVGRGRLIAEAPVEQFVQMASGGFIRVRTPDRERFAALLADGGAELRREDDVLMVTGMRIEEIGERAATAGVVLHELATQQASLEEAFMQLTDSAVEFRGSGQRREAGPASGAGQPSSAVASSEAPAAAGRSGEEQR